jgi:hypothetical protein
MFSRPANRDRAVGQQFQPRGVNFSQLFAALSLAIGREIASPITDRARQADSPANDGTKQTF